jgi:hypothetical protein
MAPAEPGAGLRATGQQQAHEAATASAAQGASTPAAHAYERVPHKHSMSLIGRIRFRRKQRRSR